MIKDVFTFKKSSWHMTMLYWVWGLKHTDFKNMCPYFWTVVATTLFFIPIIIIKYLGTWLIGLMMYTWEENKEYCDERRERWRESFKIELENGEEGAIMQLDRMLKKEGISKYDRIQWGMDNEQLQAWRDRRDAILEQRKEDAWAGGAKRRDRLAKRAEKKRLKKERLAELRRIEDEKRREYLLAHPPKPKKTKQELIGIWTVRIKIFFKIVLIALACLVAYWIYLGVVYCIYELDWTRVWSITLSILKWTGIVAGIIAVGTGLFFLGRHLWCKYGAYCSICEERQDAILKFFSFLDYVEYAKWPFIWLWRVIGWPFIKFWQGLCYIGRGFRTFWGILKRLKKDECPGLEWVD